jgi:hypothetical protein
VVQLELLEILDLLPQIFLGFAEFLLKSPQQFIVFPFGKRQVVIGQLRIFLFQFAFYFVPTALEL